ncbi:MAG: CoA-binding protein [Chitinophagales bacterium]|nr:CoA-binding protein [Bacteroidota bacterium]MBX7141776.1 CoA-binding protein [Chitinophagales bacterium]
MANSNLTVVLGASPNTERYSNLAVKQLRQHGHSVVAIGVKEGKIGDVDIIREHPPLQDVETVTLYLNPQRQPEYYNYILSLKPKRIIFNPGTENDELESLASANSIESIEACTLVMLSTGQY